MATHTVDLPAHNAYVEAWADLVSVVGGLGLDTLTDPSTSTYIRFDKTVGSDFGGREDYAFRVGRGGSMLGFGLWDQPAGTTVTDVRLVATMRLPLGFGGEIPDDGDGSWGGGMYGPGYTNFPLYRWPMMMVHYQGDPYDQGYNFSQVRTDGLWDELECAVPLQHYIGAADYVIAGIGTPDTGTFGLCPAVQIDPFYPDVHQPYVYNVAVDLAYLAIRVTYTTPDTPAPLRIHPRSSTRIYPRRNTRRPGTF